MRTLLGVFHSAERGRVARERFEQAGYDVQSIDSSHSAEEIAHGVSERGPEGNAASAASGGAVGAVMGGGVGAVPGALLGRAVGGWLSHKRAEEYSADIARGGVILIVHAEEIEPAAQAEALLYQLAADHVESGEVPVQ